MPSISCPLCSLPLTPATLQAHLRQELNYAHLRCRLCPTDFVSRDRATAHFRCPLAEHPGQPVQLMGLEEEPQKEARLVELVRLAEGGQREVDKRLCVCGQCQLVCREDFRLISYQESARSVTRSEEEENNQRWNRPIKSSTSVLSRQLQNNLTKNVTEESTETEASEPEQEIPMDIKPDLKDLKPQINADGKVACIQCGLRVEKGFFKQHAVGAHSTSRPFSCNLCPHNEKTKPALAKHQLNQHGQELTEETYTSASSESAIKTLIEQCFGAAMDVDWARLKCGPCDKLINKKDIKTHISMNHLRKPLHKCLLCPHTTTSFSAGLTNTHVRKVHKRQPGADTVDSSQAEHYAPIIKNMIPQFFSQHQ